MLSSGLTWTGQCGACSAFAGLCVLRHKHRFASGRFINLIWLTLQWSLAPWSRFLWCNRTQVVWFTLLMQIFMAAHHLVRLLEILRVAITWWFLSVFGLVKFHLRQFTCLKSLSRTRTITSSSCGLLELILRIQKKGGCHPSSTLFGCSFDTNSWLSLRCALINSCILTVALDQVLRYLRLRYSMKASSRWILISLIIRYRKSLSLSRVLGLLCIKLLLARLMKLFF